MVNKPSVSTESVPRKEANQPGECPPDSKLPENTQENLDAKLDHAIEETFPTSDPVSVTITKGGAIDYDHHEEPDTAERVLDQVRGSLNGVRHRASGAAHSAYSQGERYLRQARESYPEAERLYQEGNRAVRRRVAESPWLALLVAGATGYGLAWLIHASSRDRASPRPR